MSITPLAAATLQPGRTLRDDVVPGLQLRAREQKKSWYLYYRVAGAERRPKLGDYPALSLAAARRVAREWLERVARGEDPSLTRRQERRAPTVAGLAERFIEEHLPKRSPSTRRDYERILRRRVIPAIGQVRLSALHRSHVERLRDSLADTPVEANRTVAVVSSLCNWGARQELLETNPAQGVERFPERPRERYLTPEELQSLQRVLQERRSRWPRACLFVELLLHTGARPSEIERIRKSDVTLLDDGRAQVVLREHKTSRRTGRPRVFYVPADLAERLLELPGDGIGIRSPKSVWEQLRREAGLEGVRLYDLRHTFATVALGAGYSLDQIGRLLGHQSPTTTLRYAHLQDELAQRAAADVSERLRRPRQ